MAINNLDDLEAILNGIAETTQATAEAVTTQGEQISALSASKDPDDDPNDDQTDDPKEADPTDDDENEVAKMLGFK